MKYLLGFSTLAASSHQEDYDRAVDTIKWFVQTNRMRKGDIESAGWYNTGKNAVELTRQKDNILNVPSRTQEKKEKKLGIAKDIDKDDNYYMEDKKI